MARTKRIPGIALLAGFGGLLWWLSKKKEGIGAKIKVRAVSIAGIGNPGTITEGNLVKIVATITNTSTRLGAPVAVNFDVYFSGEYHDPVTKVSAGAFPISTLPKTQAFAAGETLIVESDPFTIPDGSGGYEGYIEVGVLPAGMSRAVATDADYFWGTATFPIVLASIVYGATVTPSI